jgi:hypothetical protein
MARIPMKPPTCAGGSTIESSEAGLMRFLHPAATLAELIATNDPEQRLQLIEQRGKCRLPQKRSKRAR